MTESIEQIALQVKSLEQRTMSVTLPRTASVLDLKQEIQLAFDVELARQRLIFQGRVLKDDKNLTDYANLDSGKVIHLVIRPTDAPRNPLNDDPNPRANNRYASNRSIPNRRSRVLPSLSSRFPLVEGYTLISLGSALRGGDDTSDFSSLLSTLSNNVGLFNRERIISNRNNNSSSTSSPISSWNRNATSRDTQTRNPFSLSSSGNNQTETTRPITPGSLLTNMIISDLPFLPSVELRLARTLGSISNVRALLELSSYNDDDFSFRSPNFIPEELQEFRRRLRNSGNTRSIQVGMVLNELADLMTDIVPIIRQGAQNLRQENQSVEEQVNTRRGVMNITHITQGISLITHLLGSVLATTDIINSGRHNTARPTSSASPQLSSERLASFVFPRGTTEAIHTNSPSTGITVAPSPSNNGNKTKKSSLSNITSSASTSTTQNNDSISASSSEEKHSIKRRLSDFLKKEEDKSDLKKRRNEKGKEKDKKD